MTQHSAHIDRDRAAHVEFHRKASAQAHKKDFMHAAVSHDDAITRLAAGQWCGFDDCAGNEKSEKHDN